ncbi:1201_t:CDS:1 [Dentiscutata heterogama]|uniref:1201_t:CDS:1 n=1 Tax=Dentiscutata heterogama TaxID=1316150 RepID=A0ACA9LTN4_9GLOM|nr:1201_t:CDS:1 [Dentiscutata heterogama]
MPPRRSHVSKTNLKKSVSNSYRCLKKNQPNLYNYPTQSYSYDKFISSFPVKINESSTGFSAFIKMAPILNVMTKKNQDRYAQWHLVSIKAILSCELDETEGKKICSLYSVLDRNKNRLTQTLFNHLLACNGVKAHKIFNNAHHNYVAEEIQ